MTYEEALRLCEEAILLLRMGATYRASEPIRAFDLSGIDVKQTRFTQTPIGDSELEEQIMKFLGQIDLALAETQELMRRYDSMNGVEELEPDELAQRIDALLRDMRKILNQSTTS